MWILFACSIVVSPGVLAIGMGIDGSNSIELDVGETEEVSFYFRGSASEGSQDITMFIENPVDGLLFNGNARRYTKNIDVDPNENTFVTVDVKGVKAGTYVVMWGHYSEGGSGGLALDARGQSTLSVRVLGEEEDEEAEVPTTRSGGGGGGGGSRTSTNVTSSCAGGKYELIGSAWMCVSKNATTNITTAVPTTSPVYNSDDASAQDVSAGEGGIAQGVVDESPGRAAVERIDEVVDAVQATTQGDVAKSALMVVLGIGLLAIVLQGALVYYAGRKA